MTTHDAVRDQLEADLVNALGWASVTVVGDDLYSVLLPSTRRSHDHLLITVQWTGETWSLTDAGDLTASFGSSATELADLLTCAGADIHLEGELAVCEVRSALDLTSELLRFGYFLSSAPVVWRARQCLQAEESRAVHPEPSVQALAREVRSDLIQRCGKRFAGVLRLRHRLAGTAGMEARVPLVASATQGGPPRLLAAFIDTTAPPRSRTAAEKDASFVIDVARDFTIPKFLVVRGETDEVERMAQFYDRSNVVTTSTIDLDPVVDALRNALPELA